ncbi:head-tail connector protein [Mangrovicoccus ximenensis]|uniref:head-tail connector protein n=1 Tax=Mangrovicoccus ximenensis TaxID=1911570 RepID=UPI000D348ADB|nr:head-tail connector protein [Mangrovicoccus ximenensis]
MSSVSVDELKAQLNLDHDLDDDLLASKIDVAEAYAAAFIGQPIPDPCPGTIKQAILMLAAYWYEFREAATSSGNMYTTPFGVRDLLQPHRTWAV